MNSGLGGRKSNALQPRTSGFTGPLSPMSAKGVGKGSGARATKLSIGGAGAAKGMSKVAGEGRPDFSAEDEAHQKSFAAQPRTSGW